MQLNFEKRGGLLPVFVQDFNTGQALMLAYVNEEAVFRSFDSRQATFWSTFRNEIWTKGATSGKTLRIREIRVDCDGDAVLYLVEPQGTGGVCHVEGRFSCFHHKLAIRSMTPELRTVDAPAPVVKSLNIMSGYQVVESSSEPRDFSRLFLDEEAMIQERIDANPEVSHTAKSLQQSVSRVAQKIGEEGLEVVLAITDPEQGPESIISEAADLLYRLQLGLVKTGISWSDVEAEIIRRRG